MEELVKNMPESLAKSVVINIVYMCLFGSEQPGKQTSSLGLHVYKFRCSHNIILSYMKFIKYIKIWVYVCICMYTCLNV